MKIEELVTKENLSDLEIVSAIRLIGELGDIILVKNDGIRESEKFTVVITSSKNALQSIRFDANLLSDAMLKALKQYSTIQ